MTGVNNHIIYLIILLLSFPTFSQNKWSIEECIIYAKEHNVDVVKQKIMNEILKKNIFIAKGNYLPDVNINTSQNFTLGNSFNVSTGVGQSESSSNNFSLSSSTNIFNGFANMYNLQKSKLSIEKGEGDLDKIRFDLTSNITNKYLNILFNKELYRVAKEQVQISKNNFDRIQMLYKNALISKSELLTIESTLASDEREELITLNNIQSGLIQLRELLSIKEINSFDVQEFIIESSGDLQTLREYNSIDENDIEENPIIKIAYISNEIKRKDIQLAKINFYPKINLNYSYGSNYFHILGQKDVILNQQTNQLVENGFWEQLDNNRTHYVGLSASIPIFNRFLTRQNFKKAQEELKISEIELENDRQLLKNKIAIAKNDLNTSIAALKASEVAFLTQQEAFLIIQENYTRGNISSYEFLESKSKLIRSTSEFIKAKYEFIFKQKLLSYFKITEK